MTSFPKGILLITSFVLIFNACSSTQEVAQNTTTEEPMVESPYPDWYTQNSFVADSLSFHGFGMAISGDSVVAMANAELQARAQLETGVSDLVEDIRESLEEAGNTTVSEPEFIIALRKAHQQVQTAANEAGQEAIQEEASFFKGYARVSISKTELTDLLESNLPSNYWDIVKSSPEFSEVFN